MVGSLFWSFAILLMIVTGLVQYAYYDRLRLVQYDELRPWLGLLCQYAHCDLPEPRDPKRIELSSKNIFTAKVRRSRILLASSTADTTDIKSFSLRLSASAVKRF